MTDLFQKRVEPSYGTAIVKYNAGTWDPETKMFYMIGRRPERFVAKFQDDPTWKAFLATKGVPEDSSMELLSATASRELAARITDETMIGRLTADIIAKITSNPERTFTSIRIVSPFPIDPAATNNTFAPTLAAAVTVALEKKLPAIFAAQGMRNIKVVADLDHEQSSREGSVLNIVNNQRGKTSDPKPGEEVEMYMQRVVRQAVYSGPIDINAIHVPVDDFLVSQSTIAGLMNYVQANGGITTSAFTGVKLFNGTEVLQPQQASLDLLNLAIDTQLEGSAKEHTRKSFQAALNQTLNKAGLNIDFQEVGKTTLSNIELLFIAGYFSDGANPAHQTAFSKALAAVGGTVEDAKGNSTHDIFRYGPGTLERLNSIFENTFNERQLMVEPEHPRLTRLVRNQRIVNYTGAAL